MARTLATQRPSRESSEARGDAALRARSRRMIAAAEAQLTIFARRRKESPSTKVASPLA